MNFHHCLFKILKKNQNVTDGRHTDGKTDGKRENSIPSHKHTTNYVCGGYNSVAPTDFGSCSELHVELHVLPFELMMQNKNSDGRQNSYNNQKLLQ